MTTDVIDDTVDIELDGLFNTFKYLAAVTDTPIGSYNLIDCRNCKWAINFCGQVVGYSYDNDDDDFAYEIDVYGTSIWRRPKIGLTFVVGDNGCGDRDMYVFSCKNEQ